MVERKDLSPPKNLLNLPKRKHVPQNGETKISRAICDKTLFSGHLYMKGKDGI